MCLCGVHNTPCLYCMAKGLDSRNDVHNQAIVNLQAENAELRRQNDEFKVVYNGLTEQNRMLRKLQDEHSSLKTMVQDLCRETAKLRSENDNLLEDVKLYKVALKTLRAIVEVAEKL